MENKQAVCDKMLEVINVTDAMRKPKELRYMKLENGTEIVRPIFDWRPEDDDRYDVDVTCDSGIAMIMDITKQFIRRMW